MSSANGGATNPREPRPYFEPGSRLKPKVLGSGDGVDTIEGSNGGWYDSELDFDCVFFPDEAGTERCFPRALVVGPRLFADAACTRPVVTEDSLGPCRDAKVRYLTGVTGCAYRAFELGEELPASSPVFFSEDGSSCKPSDASGLGRIYEIGGIPSETFVGLQRRARPQASGLDAYVREGDDGSWQIVGYFDRARDAACFESPYLGVRCAPATAAVAEIFEPGCNTRLADAHSRACYTEQPTATIAGRADTSVCPFTYDVQLREIDGIRETPSHVLNDSGACVATSGPPRDAYVQGAPIDLATLPQLETLVVGTGPLRVMFSGFGGIPYLPVAGLPFRDAAGDPCFTHEFPDGSLRCVPIAFPLTISAAFVYEDASCEGPPVVPWDAGNSCPSSPGTPRAVLLQRAPPRCSDYPTASEVIAVVGESSASVFYTRDVVNGDCEPRMPDTPPRTYLRLGEALEVTDFAQVELAVRD